MKQNLLLPHGFQKIGWVILLPSLILGGYLLFTSNQLSPSQISWLSEALVNNVALIGTAVGLIFVGFAREPQEDEMITILRLNSLLTAVYVNYGLLIVLALCFYDFRFLTNMFILLYTIPTIYYLLFRAAMHRLNKTLRDEE